MKHHFARYLHHLALVRLAQTQESENGTHAVAAIGLFRDEIGLLSGPGYGYYRTRALLSLSAAQGCLGSHQGAAESLRAAVALARQIRSLGLLAQCLEAQARESLDGAQKQKDPES